MSKKMESYFGIKSLGLKEEIEVLYMYKDCIKETYSIFYNDELPIPINLEKTFWKKYGKVKNYFDIIEDIKAEFVNEENLLRLTYYLK